MYIPEIEQVSQPLDCLGCKYVFRAMTLRTYIIVMQYTPMFIVINYNRCDIHSIPRMPIYVWDSWVNRIYTKITI